MNRKARHEYFIEDTYTAGLELSGTEVKSIRAGKVSLQESYARVENGELWLIHMHIAPYEQGNIYNLDPLRKRKLLMKKHEIEKLQAVTQQKGLALIPVQIFFQRGFAKIELGVGKGKKLYDKRDAIAERDVEREQRRAANVRE